ncbi:hypothetical protein [Pseudomonas sp. NMI1173_11]|uniref:hypothetical protein n=1 Tax=Pseudomonas sp. NMI1173_11 TaxID=2903145 RepID=UPI001E39B127|nr:hypothetical protein [Pseudomonas sp. NMI1173_11]MCE1004975.1 hypothetical protein [Pseudomonas sp. NMI1173_11]
MSADITIEFHSRSQTELQLRRIEHAMRQTYPVPIAGFLSDVFFSSQRAVGIVFGHIDPGVYEQRADGHILQTAAICRLWKQGRFWVATTEEGRYVLTSFMRDVGRKSLRVLIEKAESHS